MSEGELETLSQAERMLASIATAADAVAIIRLAEVARVYAEKARLGTAAINHATIIKMRAERRLAEVVDAGQANGDIATNKDGGRPARMPTPSGDIKPLTLEQIGTNPARLQEARIIRDRFTDADLSDLQAEAAEEDRELSRKALITRPPHVAANTGESEWYTPLGIITAARNVMGGIDLDPASCADANEIVGATAYYTADDNGLTRPWKGRIWMNPPYAQPACAEFCTRLAVEYWDDRVTAAIALVNNATETAWFQDLAEHATAVCFPRGRVRFWHPIRIAAPLQGQALLYLGHDRAAFTTEFRRFGIVAAL
jgi:ParB family chromosome partitioning protein